MKKGFYVLIGFLVLGSLGSAFSDDDSSETTTPKTTPLTLVNSSKNQKTDKNGNYTFKLRSAKNAKIKVTVSSPKESKAYDNLTIKHVKSKNYTVTVNLKDSVFKSKVTITAKTKSQKTSHKSFTLTNTAMIHKNSSKKKESHSNSSQTKPHAWTYKPVQLEKFTEDPAKYSGTNIETSGTVVYIQKNPDDETIYFVVIIPKDAYSSSGYSDGHGTVAQVDIDTMDETPISEGNAITVFGGGLTNAVNLDDQVVPSSIIVDHLTVN